MSNANLFFFSPFLFSFKIASYGSLSRFRDLRRLQPIGNHTIVGASGEYSDFQYLLTKLDDIV